MYDLKTFELGKLPPMNEKRCSFEVCFLDGYLYAVGGWSTKTVERFVTVIFFYKKQKFLYKAKPTKDYLLYTYTNYRSCSISMNFCDIKIDIFCLFVQFIFVISTEFRSNFFRY